MEKLNGELNILIVEDDEGHAELVRRNLLRGGISNSITIFSGGEAALDYIFKRGAYTGRSSNCRLLVLLDINMVGIDGIEVLRQVKQHPTKRRIPIIMLTTTDDPREIEQCYRLGCSVYITKPVTPERFNEAIRRLGLFIPMVSLPEENNDEGRSR